MKSAAETFERVLMLRGAFTENTAYSVWMALELLTSLGYCFHLTLCCVIFEGLQQSKSLHRHPGTFKVYIWRFLEDDLGTKHWNHCHDYKPCGKRKSKNLLAYYLNHVSCSKKCLRSTRCRVGTRPAVERVTGMQSVLSAPSLLVWGEQELWSIVIQGWVGYWGMLQSGGLYCLVQIFSKETNVWSEIWTTR